MIIAQLKAAAEAVGLSAFITNADNKLDVQLNRLTREEDLPLIMISWDMKAGLSFSDLGIISQPAFDITCLVLTKPEELSKDEMELEAEGMAQLYCSFLQVLNNQLTPLLRDGNRVAITNANLQLIPKYGPSSHSGILGKFTVRVPLTPLC